MSEKEEKQNLPTAILAILILLFALRPYVLPRLEFLIFLIENGLLLENIFLFFHRLEVFSLLVIFILLYIFRNPLGRAINRRIHSLIAKDLIEEFDKDGDNTLYKEESQHFFDTLMKDEKNVFISKKDSDALFDKHDSNKDGKLDSGEITSLILELFHDLRTKEGTQTSLSEDDPVQEEASEDETQKLDRLYNEGYLSEERYERLKQDLSR